MSNNTMKEVAITEIRENPVALRGVNREDPAYISLRDSVKDRGVQLPITVREKSDETGTYYEIVDGLHRYSSSLDTGKTTIPVKVIEATEAEALELQIISNLCRVDTAPAAYAKQLQRMFTLNPTLTKAEIAARVNQSTTWVDQRLGLLKLTDEIQKLVDDDKIPVSSAYALAGLPPEEQVGLVDAAMTMPAGEFLPLAKQRKDEVNKAKREGRKTAEQTFEATAHLRKMSEIKAALEGGVASAECAKAKAKNAEAGFLSAINWVLSLDAESVAAAKDQFEARIKAREETKAKNAAERAEKKAKEAAEAAEKAKAALASQG